MSHTTALFSVERTRLLLALLPGHPVEFYDRLSAVAQSTMARLLPKPAYPESAWDDVAGRRIVGAA